MPYDGGHNLEEGLKVVGVIGAVGFVLAALFLTHKARPEPKNSLAYGCYTTDQAAPIVLSKRGMLILQHGFPLIGYHLERHKTGIALTAEKPIVARPAGPRYIYSIEYPGEGLYLDFFKVVDGQRYGVFEENHLSSFTMLARDGTDLLYRGAQSAECSE
ncbi:MAG TPA: hypothetical protein VF481_01360 [Novosphingobium sp.]